MTPAELARKIDEEEFEAECQRIRQRAFAHVQRCREMEREKIKAWATGEQPVAAKPSSRDWNERHEVNGVNLTLREWAKRLNITPQAFGWRIERLGSVKAAIDQGPSRKAVKVKAGVPSNLPALLGTGGGPHAQDIPEIEFSE